MRFTAVRRPVMLCVKVKKYFRKGFAHYKDIFIRQNIEMSEKIYIFGPFLEGL